MAMQAGFFDVDERLKCLSDLGDQLEAYAGAVDSEIFRAELDKLQNTGLDLTFLLLLSATRSVDQ